MKPNYIFQNKQNEWTNSLCVFMSLMSALIQISWVLKSVSAFNLLWDVVALVSKDNLALHGYMV